MEIWTPAFPDIFSENNYDIELTNGDKNGLIITLLGEREKIRLYFGIITAFQMYEENLDGGGYSFDELKRFQENHCRDRVYKIKNGKFCEIVKKESLGLWNTLQNPLQYIIITGNYLVNIICDGEPKIKRTTLN